MFKLGQNVRIAELAPYVEEALEETFAYEGRTGTIVGELTNGVYDVEFGDTRRYFYENELELYVPQVGDRVIVTSTDLTSREQALVNGSTTIVATDVDRDFTRVAFYDAAGEYMASTWLFTEDLV